MDRVPLEIVDLVVSLVDDRGCLPSLATLSTRWQAAVERRTFEVLNIGSDDLDDFSGIVARCGRLSHIRILRFTASGPFDESTVKRRQQRQRFSQDLTAAFKKLFQALASLESTATIGSGLGLEVGRIFSTKRRQPGKPEPLRLPINIADNAKSLPLVHCVDYLGVSVFYDERTLSLPGAIYLASRLPNVNKINLMAAWYEPIHRPNLHRQERHSLAAALSDVDFLRHVPGAHFTFKLEIQDPYTLSMNSNWNYPDCTNDLGYEPLGAAFRKCSHHLSALHLAGVFDESLFRMTEAERRHSGGEAIVTAPAPADMWSNLTELVVELGQTTPTGGWYFVPDDSGTEYPNRGISSPPRNIPNDDTMQPLFASWADYIAELPSLKQAALMFLVEVFFSPRDSPGGGGGGGEAQELQHAVEHWIVEYQAPHTTPDPARHPWGSDAFSAQLSPEEFGSRRLVFARVGAWRPWRPTMRKLREVGGDVYKGTKMVELEVDVWQNVTRDKPGMSERGQED